MTAFSHFWYYLWIAPHLLQLAILAVMARRGLHRQFPMFFLYNVSEILQFVLLFGILRILGASSLYLSVYSLGMALSTVLRFGVAREVLVHVLRGYPSLNHRGKTLFYEMALVLLFLAVALAVGTLTRTTDLLSIDRVLDRSMTILQSALIVFLFLFSRYFALSWRNQAFGIALGLGIFSSVELATSAVRLHVGPAGNNFLNFLTMGTYHFCVLIWLFYFMASERPPKYNSKHLPDNDLESWNQELQKLIQK